MNEYDDIRANWRLDTLDSKGVCNPLRWFYLNLI